MAEVTSVSGAPDAPDPLADWTRRQQELERIARESRQHAEWLARERAHWDPPVRRSPTFDW